MTDTKAPVGQKAKWLARADQYDVWADKAEARAKGYREKAASLRALAARNKGDAEREKETIRQSLDLVPGDLVSAMFGVRRVTKVNAKSIRVEGVSIAIEKHLVRRATA